MPGFLAKARLAQERQGVIVVFVGVHQHA
jgi:hypothetical protein